MAIASTNSTSLGPGFRFYPTDEELVCYYLRRKVCGRSFRFDAISDVDIYKVEPWDLPGKSLLKARDLEWYFFSALDKKYGNGSKTNRATDGGYWKTTGKDHPVRHKSQMVGMKKTLVYHNGRAPRGERTNWVMHEYRLVDDELEKAGISQDSFVLCRVFQKSGPGPKNGEHHGAPFVEEEWEDSDLVLGPKKEKNTGDIPVGDNFSFYKDGLDQSFGKVIQPDDGSSPLFWCFDSTNHLNVSTNLTDDALVLLEGTGENLPAATLSDDPKILHWGTHSGMDAKSLEHEFFGEPSNNMDSVDVDFLLDTPFVDATDNLLPGEGAFLETNELTNNSEADPGHYMIDEHLTYIGGSADDFPDNFDLSIETEDMPNLAPLAHRYMNEGSPQVPKTSLLIFGEQYAASSLKQELTKLRSDAESPITKHTSEMLSKIHAPPAHALECPTKKSAIHLASATHSFNQVHVAADTFQIGTGNRVDLSFGKPGQVNIALSFGLSQSEDNLVNLLFGKAASVVSQSWVGLLFLWGLILSMSFKLGTYIFDRSFES